MRLPRAPEAGLRLAVPKAWQRCAFDACALVDDGVELMWQRWPQTAAATEVPAAAFTTGLAFDRLGRALRAVHGAGLETLPLAAQAEALSLAPPPAWTSLPATPLQGCGAGAPVDAPQPGQPGALATSAPDLLWVAEAAAQRVWRYDLWGRRYLGAVVLPAAPVALCAAGADAVLALLRHADGRGGLALLRACAPPLALPWPAALREPASLALAADGTLWVLLHAGTPQALLVNLGLPAQAAPGLQVAAPGASALAIGTALRDTPHGSAAAQRLFAAMAPGTAWSTFTLDGAADRPVVAPGYDGGAIAALHDGRVAYVATAQGAAELRFVAPTRLARERRGRVLSFRFDSEQAGARWGRVWLEACVAPNTALVLRCLVSDDDAAALDEAPRTPPANQAAPAPDGFSPPLPDTLALAALHDTPARPCATSSASGQRGSRAGWRQARPGHAWLESWVGSEEGAVGRFLWVEVELQGDGLRTPVLRALEVEQPGHAWLSQLPALFSREAQAADFLRRYLAGPANLLADLGVDADARHRLLAPGATPAAMLDWLAALLGLALQPAWSETARRTLLAEAGRMAPRHGTPEVLRRIVEILADAPVLLIEDFRLRAPGVIGGAGNGTSAGAVLGGGIRLGASQLGEDAPEPVELGAWRFTLLLQAEVDEAQLAMLRDAVQRFKPAHTAFSLCALESGLRVGRGLHLDLAALVGPDSGLPLPLLGATRLGRDAVLGRSAGPDHTAGAAPC